MRRARDSAELSQLAFNGVLQILYLFVTMTVACSRAALARWLPAFNELVSAHAQRAEGSLLLQTTIPSI